MSDTFTCTFNISGNGTRKSSATINVGYNFVNTATNKSVFSGTKTFDCRTDEDGILLYDNNETIPFKIENEKIGGYTINVDCSISAVEDNVTFQKNSITITQSKKEVWVEFNDYGELIAADLSGLVDGTQMFKYTNVGQITNEDGTVQSITFDYDLSSLTDSFCMFETCDKLTSFDSDLSSLLDGEMMFYGCTNLTSFTSELPNLTNGEMMFSGCDKLTSFTSELPNLTNGDSMFEGCSLTSFSSELSSLTDGHDMFSGCSLTSFSSDLPSLTNGWGMFSGSNLDAASVQNIAETINGNVTDNPRLDLGVDENIVDDSNVKRCFSIILQKGWNVYVNYVQFIEENNN